MTVSKSPAADDASPDRSASERRAHGSGRLTAALADQATVAGSNFLFQMVVARYASVEEFAAFALGYTGIALATAVHAGLVAEPILVHVASVSGAERREYLASVLRFNARISAAVALAAFAIGAVAMLSGSRAVGHAVLAMSIAVPAILLQRLSRSISYGVGSPVDALRSTAIYASVSVLLAILAGRAGFLNGWGAYLPLLLGGVAGSWTLRGIGGSTSGGHASTSDRFVKSMHFGIGSWSAGAQVLSWVPWNAFLMVVSWFRPADDVASFRVALTLFLPALHAMWALSPLLVPKFADSRRRGEARWTSLWRPIAGAVGGALIFSVVLVLARHSLIGIAFGERYLEAAEYAVWLAVLPVMTALTVVVEAYFRAARLQRHVFFARLAGVTIGLAAGVPLVMRFGVLGAIVSQAATLVAGFAILMTSASRLSTPQETA